MLPRRAAPILLALLSAGCTDPQPCPAPLEACEGQCVDILSDPRHCGGCGRECAPGAACVAATCDFDPDTACHLRTGGAFVTLGHCGNAVKLWIENPAFLTEVAGRVGLPVAPRVPSLVVRVGADCDAQWSWRVDAIGASFVNAPPTSSCDVCPVAVQEDAGDGVLASAAWCPTAAVVLSVDSR